MDIDEAEPPLRWSASFSLLPEQAVSTINLSGDKIILPQSALEQLLAANEASTAPTTSRYGHGFQSPFSMANGSNQRQLPNPLIFRLVNPKNKTEVYAGIREFSAPDETVGLSSYLQTALGIGSGDTSNVAEIQVHAATLPKGTFARLRPLEAGYNPDDWKPLLERQLRHNFTSLTKDTQLIVNGVHGERYQLLVDKLSPEGPGVCVVDTDLEVDVEALNEDQARETMQHLINTANGQGSNNATGGELSIWKDVEFAIEAGSYVDFALPSWDRSQHLTFTLSNIPESVKVDLFVSPKSSRQRALPRITEHIFGDFDEAIDGSKMISMSPSNIELENAEVLLVSVYSGTENTAGPVQLKLRANIGSQVRPEEPNSTNEQTHGPDEAQCTNCLKWMQKQKMVLHEAFCRRNNVLCGQCKKVFQKGSQEWEAHWHCEFDAANGDSAASKERHNQIYHKDVSCPGCPFTTNSIPDLARHRTTTCPAKIILCQFCHLEVPQEGDPFQVSPEVALSGLTAHELADGSRTTECHLCNKIVRLRDMETHMKHHEMDKAGKSLPRLCRNANCGRTQYGVGSRGQVLTQMAQDNPQRNDLNLCAVCFGPLYVSMHDPEGKALRRRIERRYLGQLMTGCGKSYCRNEWCKTGRRNQGREILGSSSKNALAATKPLMAALADLSQPVYFCVDEASQKQRSVAEMLAAEKTWDFEWCIAAAEAEKGQATGMRDWLQAWAPRR